MVASRHLGHLTTAFASFTASRAGDAAWLQDLRRQAFAGFTQLGLPTRAQEEWKYTNVRALAELPLSLGGAGQFDTGQLAGYVNPDEINLVFVDGILRPDLSTLQDLPAGVHVMPLADALVHKPERLAALLTDAQMADAAHQPFALLARAFTQHGVYIEIERNVVLARPVHIVHANAPAVLPAAAADAAAGTAVCLPRQLIVVGDSAAAQVTESYLGQGDAPYVVITSTDIILSPNAALKHARVQRDGAAAYHISHTGTRVPRSARLETLSIAAGSLLCRNDLDAALTGPGAELTLDGLYLVRGAQHIDNHTLVDHQVPDATSAQLYKGIVADQGRAVFNGKVIVREDAQRTSARQLNRNLLLSSDAEVDTKPELQIDADDVKCSHGATVGQLNPDEVFYLQTRGLTHGEAVRVLSAAFADDVLMQSSLKGLRDRLRSLTVEFLAP